MDKISS